MLTGPLITAEIESALSFLGALTEAEQERQEEIVLARKFHEGAEGALLTARLKQWLGEDIPFRLNVARSVVTAVAERLTVTGFDSENETFLQWVSDMWERLKLDAMQEDVHEGALRDGEYFVIVSWDNEMGVPQVIPHQRYTDTEVEGDGFGCWIRYTEDDPNQAPEYAVKQWTVIEETEFGQTVEAFQRRNIYFPDRVEKYIRDRLSAEWVPFTDPGDEEWPIPWVDEQGAPLGIAVIPFNNKGLRCEAWDAFPLQRAVNKCLVDLMSTSDMTAFRIYYSLGFIPTTDGKQPADDRSNWMKIEPGQVVGTTRPAREVDFGAIEPSELNSQMDLVHQIVLWLAMVTNTPVTRFVSTKLIASDATLKEQEGPLISRVTSRQRRFGNSWVQVVGMMRRLQNVFGDEDVDEEATVKPIWGEAAARGEDEKLDLLEKKQVIGVPREQLWKEAGYDQSQINKMKEMSRDDRQDRGSDQNGRSDQDLRDGDQPTN
jgi:hypothetical protein